MLTAKKASDLPVCRHFASPGHSTTYMLVSVMPSAFRDTQDSRRFEVRVIFLNTKGCIQEDLIPTLPSYKLPKSTCVRNIEVMFDLNLNTRTLYTVQFMQVTSNFFFSFVWTSCQAHRLRLLFIHWCSKWKNTYMLLAGWEIRIFPIRTDRKPVNNVFIFFFLR